MKTLMLRMYVYIYILELPHLTLITLMQINFNDTNLRVMHIFCLTRGPTRSWRNGDAQCCQLSSIADPFSNFFLQKTLQKSIRTLFRFWESSEVLLSKRAYISLSLSLSLSLSAQFLFSVRSHISLSLFLALCVCSVSVQRTAAGKEEQSLIQLNTDIILLASLIFYDASIAEITAQLLSLSYVYLIS